MAASLLLRRRVSRTLQGLAGNVKPFCLHLELKVGVLVSISDKTRLYSSSSGTTTFDFLDLTYLSCRRSFSAGIYCGPLRLLAWEVAKRLNKAKVPCDLLTGQEREEVDGAKHKAVTVEMADVTSNYHCAVIDEIQMLGCRNRGFSFTRALLGVSADELHVCGDPAAIPLIQKMFKVTSDQVEGIRFCAIEIWSSCVLS